MKFQQEQKPSMELLAPAGSFSAFLAALEEGADAVYVGAPRLNARALARDFSYSEIDALVREAHRKGVRLYIAMNSLVKEDEIGIAVEGLAMFDQIGPDALIIQDIGLLRLARKYFPQLPLHASTLMSVHNSLAVQKMIELGFKRVVLPRELTLQEIGDIHEKTGAELEVFVHGAMCFSYSGLCLFSSMFGGKSSLRGQCVQPCRRRYGWQRKKGFVKQGRQTEKDGGYLFSMHDLSGVDLLPRLKEAGVACLKIEGRLKSAEYVRKTVRAYRLLLGGDGAPGSYEARKKEASRYLDEAMGRKRSTGFFLSDTPHEAVTPGLSGNIGLPAGRILNLEEKQEKGRGSRIIVTVALKRDIEIGDRLRLHDEGTGERTAFTLRTMLRGNRTVRKASPEQKVQLVLNSRELKIRKGSFRGSLFKVDIGSFKNEEQLAKNSILKRNRHEVKPDTAGVQHILNELIVPPGKTNRHAHGRRDGRLPVWVMVQSLRDRQYRLPMVPEKYIVPLTAENLELLRTAPAKLRRLDHEIIWNLPPVISDAQLAWYGKAIDALVDDGFQAFQLGHISQTGYFDRAASAGKECQIYMNYTCNVLNSSALELLRKLRVSGMQFSLETDAANLESALDHFSSSTHNVGKGEVLPAVGMYVFGHPPLFTARLNDFRYRYGRRFVSPRGEIFTLDRNDDMTMATATVPFSLLGERQELARCGIDYLIVDLSRGNMKKNLSELTALIKGGNKDFPVMSGNFRTGLL